MNLHKILFLSIVVSLLSFVELEASNDGNDLVLKKVKSWIPLENSEEVKIYYFDVTNSKEYLDNKDEKIRVKETGPVAYRKASGTAQFLSLSSDENIASFQINPSYIFNEDLMKNFDKNKTFTTFNPDFMLPGSIDDSIPINETKKVFDSTTFSSLIIDLKSFNFPSTYRVFTAKTDASLEGKIDSVRENSRTRCLDAGCSLTYKESKVTDVQLQFLRNKSISVKDESEIKVLFFYTPVTFVFKNRYLFKGLNVSRYELDESALSMKAEDNKCLCEDKNKKVDGVSLCDMTGILDMKKCILAPLVYSSPHLLDASSVLHEHIKGLQPNATKHRSYVDVDPATGVVLNYRLSMQINAFIDKIHLGHGKNSTLIPLFWSDNFSEKSDQFMEVYKKQRLNFI